MTSYSPLRTILMLAPSLRSASQRALSVYIPVRTGGYDARHYEIVFGDLLHRYRERLDDEGLAVMEEELPRLRHALATARPAGCAGVAGFSDSGAGVLELIKLPASTQERLEVGELLLAPMLRQLEQFPPALVAVVDKERTRVFRWVLDEVAPAGSVDGEDVRHSKAGGASSLNLQHRADNRARVNLQKAVHLVEREMQTGAFAQIYVAGPDEALAEFEHLLPEALRPVVAGRVGASLDSPHLAHDLLASLRDVRALAPKPLLKVI